MPTKLHRPDPFTVSSGMLHQPYENVHPLSFSDEPWWGDREDHVGTRSSYAVSIEALTLESVAVRITGATGFVPAGLWNEYRLWMGIPFPDGIVLPRSSKRIDDHANLERHERDLITAELRAAFEHEPLEDGVNHPAEEVVERVVRSFGAKGALELLSTLCLDDDHPTLGASVFRCVGRCEEPGTEEWRASLVQGGLAAGDVEIRDAAVQAVEHWREPSLAPLLEAHDESFAWLREYIAEVIADLSAMVL